MDSLELEKLRTIADAAAEQLLKGPKEWPGRPSAQRLALFLALPPDKVLKLIDLASRNIEHEPSV